MTRATGWRPASHCDNAVHTLRWDGPTMTWILARIHLGKAHPVATVHGYPLDGQPVDARAAKALADHILGPQEWINRPYPSTAWHTHPGKNCP